MHLPIDGDKAVMRAVAFDIAQPDVDNAFEFGLRARVHDADPGRQHDSLIDIMRNKEHSFARAAPDLGKFALHGRARVGVESRKWFIHQEHLRLVGEHARNLDPLFHAA